MTGTLQAAISCDIDTLASSYKGYGCRRPGSYTYAELYMGLENLSRFLELYGVKATLFMVGSDFQHVNNHGVIRAAAHAGHEIANHTLTHIQGFRLLTPEQKEEEIAGMERLCEQVIGQRPVGFRAPGWNASDDALPILMRRGYLYDSSVFPSALNLALKFLHWWSMRGRPAGERTTLGPLRYMLAPTRPYRTAKDSLARRGGEGLVEFPVTVLPVVRLPFWATFLLATGLEFFEVCYRVLRAAGWPIQYQFHLSDFVDYSRLELTGQVPDGHGVYVPQALRTPLGTKWNLFRRAVDIIAEDYTFVTLEQWARSVA